MIENIRNYYWLMIVALVAVGASLIFSDFGFNRPSGGRNTAYIRIDGTNYSVNEFEKQGRASAELSMGLGMLMDFTAPLEGFGDPENFFIRRMLVRSAAEEFGIKPSDDEIAVYVKSLVAFTDRSTGKFDPAAYRNVIEKHIGRYGMTEADLLAMAGDALTIKKLSEILGSGLRPNREVLAQNSALDRQKITAQVARIDVTSFKETIKPTDEEVKAYWEDLQEAFKTEPQRKFTYILAAPKLPEVAATPEAGAEEKPDPTKEDPKIIEERKNQEKALLNQVGQFMQQLETSRGSRFEEIAAEFGFESKSTELFPPSAPPADLGLNHIPSPGGPTGRVADTLFGLITTPDAFSKISEAYHVGENQWLVARVDEEVPSRVKTFEEAKDEVTAQYIEEKAKEALQKSAEEKLAQIRTAVSAGKSFADAAKEAGLESKAIDEITRSYRPTDGIAPSSTFGALRTVDPGSVADVIVEIDKAYILFVEKREVEKVADADAMLDSEVEGYTDRNQRFAFTNWLNERHQNAKIEHLIKER
jgi:DNA-binding phage protein